MIHLRANLPTIFHITHWKSGSQWVAGILRDVAQDRIIPPSDTMDQILLAPIVPGAIYPTIYLPYPRFMKIFKPSVDVDIPTFRRSNADPLEVQNWYNFNIQRKPIKKVMVIRDPRDTLVSLYYSLKISHPLINDHVSSTRRTLADMELEDGLLYVLENRFRNIANIQNSWMPPCARGEALLLRYEDMIADERGEFVKLIEYCEINVPAKKLARIIDNNSFVRRAGRKPGQEDISSHYRKGISGDWKNVFTDHLKAEFKQRYGRVLIATGYEKDFTW
jgi:lipopolysaccharide transport system ATP-binding protein